MNLIKHSLFILSLLLLTGCFVLGDVPKEENEYDNTIINASLYNIFTEDPNWTRARVVSSEVKLDTMITILRRSDMPRNRVVYHVDMHESVWGYTSVRYVKKEHPYIYQEKQVGVIRELLFPYVILDKGTFNFYDFIYDYRSEPPYNVGDVLHFVATKDTLNAIY